jgi:hypothetical protein
MRMPCTLEVRGDRLIFDLTEAPPQVPHFINSKEYIIRAQIAPRMRQLLAPGVPFNQSVLDGGRNRQQARQPGQLHDAGADRRGAYGRGDGGLYGRRDNAFSSRNMPRPARPAGRRSSLRRSPLTATGRWTYIDDFGKRRVYTLIDGAFSGSPAAGDRDGIDIKNSQVPGGNQLEFADVEILENAYPLLFVERRATSGIHGYGRFRSGAGYQGASARMRATLGRQHDGHPRLVPDRRRSGRLSRGHDALFRSSRRWPDRADRHPSGGPGDRAGRYVRNDLREWRRLRRSARPRSRGGAQGSGRSPGGCRYGA